MTDDNKMTGPIRYKLGYQNTRVLIREEDARFKNAPDMLFETVHPGNKKINCILTFLNPNPDNVFSSTFSYDDARNPRNLQKLHYHDFFELLYIIRGEMYQQIESERHLYPAGSLCLLNCHVRHMAELSTDYRAVFLRLPVSLVKELLNDMDSYFFEIEHRLTGHLLEHFFTNNLDEQHELHKEYVDFIPCEDKPDVKEYMYGLFDQLTQQLLFPGIGSSYLVKCTLIRILRELSIQSHYRVIPLNIGTDAQADLFNSVSRLIRNSHGHISRKELEEKLSYNGDYLNRIVKKYTGLNMKQYGLTYSLKEAAALLRNTDMYVSDICRELGFNNQTYFYKSFEKTYGMTPKKYRSFVSGSDLNSSENADNTALNLKKKGVEP